MSLSPGQDLGRYTVVRALDGVPGIEAWLVMHRVLLQARRMEVYPADGSVLVHVSLVDSGIEHPALVRAVDRVELPGGVGLVLDAGDEPTWETWAGGPLRWAELTRLFRPALRALAEVHRHGLVHRALGPGRLLVGSQGGETWLRVAGLGVERLVVRDPAGGELRFGAGLGEPGFMPPEQDGAFDARDPRVDVWALGRLWFDALRGERWMAGAGLDALRAAASRGEWEGPLAALDLEPAARAVLARALDPDPSRRHDDAGALLAAVDGLGSRGTTVVVAPPASARPTMVPEAPLQPPPAAPAEAPPEKPRGGGIGAAWKGIQAVIALLVVVGMVAAGLYAWQQVGSAPPELAPLEQAPKSTAPGSPDRVPGAPVAPAGAGVGGRAPEGGSATPAPREGGGGARGGSGGSGSGGTSGSGGSRGSGSAPAVPEARPSSRGVGPAEGAGSLGSVSPPGLAPAAEPTALGIEPVADAAPAPVAPPGREPVAAPVVEARSESAAPAPPEASVPALAEASVPAPAEGTWDGRWQGRPLKLRVEGGSGGVVTARLEVLVGTTPRTYRLVGGWNGERFELREEGGAVRVTGVVRGESLEGQLVLVDGEPGSTFSASLR